MCIMVVNPVLPLLIDLSQYMPHVQNLRCSQNNTEVALHQLHCVALRCVLNVKALLMPDK